MTNPKKHPVKITIFKCISPEEVFGPDHDIRKISGERITKCSLEEGSEFLVKDIEQFPKGFCMWAWRDLYKDLSVLFFGGNFIRRNPDTIFVSCTDGRKPVIFKLERLEEI